MAGEERLGDDFREANAKAMFRKYKGGGRKRRKAKSNHHGAVDERTLATTQTGKTRERNQDMARDVIFIHETLAKGRTEDIYEASAQNIASFGICILLPTDYGPHRLEFCDLVEDGVHSAGKKDSHYDENRRHNDTLKPAAQHGIRNDGKRLVDDHVRQEEGYK